MFPSGAPGLALLVLRICVAIELAESAFLTGWQHTAFLVLLSLLCIGLLTPVICWLAAAGVLFDMAHAADVHIANGALVVLSTLSLAFLGPGAFSIDGRLFGRRIVISTSGSSCKED